jgi:hypothetical protein
MVTLPSRIAQSGYNAQTIVSEKFSNADAVEPLAIGVDIGGTGIKAAIVGLVATARNCHEPSPALSPLCVTSFIPLYNVPGLQCWELV